MNHGSFGACPTPVLEAQSEWRARMEREPVLFLHREHELHVDAARAKLATFVGADPDDLAFVPNATTGVNTVLRSLEFTAGDELVTTDHEYNACRNVLDFVAKRAGARVVVVPVPLPITDPNAIVVALQAAIRPRTKLLLIDHITSPTGLVMPMEAIVAAFRARGIDVLVDGAHAPGMLDLQIERLGASYYTGNCHKWICSPKGSALLWVERSRQSRIRPLAISHGANSARTDRSRFRLEFDFTGTADYTPFLCVPTAIDTMAGMFPGGWAELRTANRALAIAARDVLQRELGAAPIAPESMLGSLAAVALPPATVKPDPVVGNDPLHERLFRDHHIEVPVPNWPRWPNRLLRVAAQAYNALPQYEYLARSLRPALAGT